MDLQQSKIASSLAVCTLWEGDYHKGLGALVNSLASVGFQGKVWAGYRGSLPGWAAEGTTQGVIHSLPVSPTLELLFVKLDTEQHFSQYKPIWLQRIFNEFQPTATGVYYFDPDILTLAEWSFFENWLESGIAACEDAHYPLNPTHPLVARWNAYAENIGLTIRKPAQAYLNSGLVGLKREHISFLDDWKKILDAAQREFGVKGKLQVGTRASMFHNIDQEAFTIASWTSEHPVSWVGIDGMGFGRGEWLTLHATGKKPWRRRILRDLFVEASAPDRAARRYWDYVSHPIQVEPSDRVRQHRFLVPFAALVSRFYSRR